jgi:transcriptional regulator with XRE-family HTH domain
LSSFGEHLRALIDSNGINIYGLAKQAGLERTAIHKIISGGRIPSEEYVKKLADALPLSPEEHQRFMESYLISKIGEFRYRQRIQVKKLIEAIAYIENGGGQTAVDIEIKGSPLSETNTTAIGHFAVNNLVKSVIEEAVTPNGAGAIDFFIPESYGYFYSELLACYLRYPKLQIRQILSFSKKTGFTDNTNRNLSLLSHILPFAFAPGAEYHPYYYYSAANDAEPTSAMPYFVLTASNRLVLINADLSKAAFICDKDIVSLYKENFQAMLERAKPLIKYFNSTFEVLMHCIETDDGDAGEPFHWIEPEPCVGPLVTDEMVRAQIKQEIPNRDGLIELVCRHYGFLRENQLRNMNICTTDGLYRIINSGYIYNAPTEIIDKLSRETIMYLLNELRNRIENKKVKVLFTNPSKITIPNKTLLSINRRTGINFIKNDGSDSGFRAICLSEDSIDEAFTDFIESIEESGLVYNEADSLATLDSIIAVYIKSRSSCLNDLTRKPQ